MTIAVCLLVGADARTETIVRGALGAVFPGVNLLSFKNREAAANHDTLSGTELLLLANADSVTIATAVEATDAEGLPRWAVVGLGKIPETEGAEMVAPGELNEAVLARAFRSAVAQHCLRRQNARSRGDLRTIASRIAHDLRTPIGGIVSATEMVKEAGNDSALAPLLQPIFNSSDDMIKLIERVSFVLKATTNPVAKKPVAMKEIVWAASQRLEVRMNKSGAALLQPDDWPEVMGVAPWLETIWWNFLINAVQHGGEKPRIRIGWSRDVGEHRFWIQDSGAGVPEERRLRLFQHFHLLHQPNAARGLGLSIVQRLVELQGGRGIL